MENNMTKEIDKEKKKTEALEVKMNIFPMKIRNDIADDNDNNKKNELKRLSYKKHTQAEQHSITIASA